MHVPCIIPSLAPLTRVRADAGNPLPPNGGVGCLPGESSSAFGPTGHSVHVCMPDCGPAPARTCPPSATGKGTPKCTISPSGTPPPVYCTLGCASVADCPTGAVCWKHPQLGGICAYPSN